MVTVGEEGFWATGAAREAANPGTGWASMTGQNFSENMAPAAIDFAAVHLWPDNWGVSLCHSCLELGSRNHDPLAAPGCVGLGDVID